MNIKSRNNEGLRAAIAAARRLSSRKSHGVSELARLIGLQPQAVSQWTEVPPMRVLDVEKVTGIPRGVLRPDLYPDDRGVA